MARGKIEFKICAFTSDIRPIAETFRAEDWCRMLCGRASEVVETMVQPSSGKMTTKRVRNEG